MTPRRLLATASLASILIFGCTDAASDAGPPAATSGTASESSARALADRPISSRQIELLELAYRAASSMPLNPHVKNRSRAQHRVVEAAFELDQPHRAVGYARGIENWRRGLGYAGFALYAAERGATESVSHYVALANDLAERAMAGEDAQDWRHDRVRALIARAYLAMGDLEKVAEYEKGLADSERGPVQAARARAGAFDDQLAALDRIFEAGAFDHVRNAMLAAVELYDAAYADRSRRDAVEERVRTAYPRLPRNIRIERVADLAEVALAHGDAAKAAELASSAFEVLEAGGTWLAEHRVPMVARLAVLLHRAGERDEARRRADAALDRYDAERTAIVDIHRAGVLRSVAEAYHAMGETERALEVYRRAVEAGAVNPNSRPRADDLVDTCLSLARHAVAHDGALETRLKEVCAGLSHPW